MNTNNLIQILIVIAVIIIIAGIAWYAIRKSRRARMKEQFGPEYEYAVKKEGSSLKAEKALDDRQKRVNELDILQLDDDTRARYNDEWLDIQANFVDDPKEAVEQANRLVTEVMIARGFPVADFEQRAADLSVLYPQFVPDYRNAHAIAIKNRNDGTSTEELRQAMVYYHSLFGELLEGLGNKELQPVK